MIALDTDFVEYWRYSIKKGEFKEFSLLWILCISLVHFTVNRLNDAFWKETLLSSLIHEICLPKIWDGETFAWDITCRITAIGFKGLSLFTAVQGMIPLHVVNSCCSDFHFQTHPCFKSDLKDVGFGNSIESGLFNMVGVNGHLNVYQQLIGTSQMCCANARTFPHWYPHH